MFSTIVNLAEVNGLGAMGNLGSEATKASCLPPPTEIEPNTEIRSFESTKYLFFFYLSKGHQD